MVFRFRAPVAPVMSLWMAVCGALLPQAPVLAQTPAKKVVKTQNDLPRFNYPISGTASQLLQADAATFNVFASKVRADIDSVLRDYDIQDRATLRDLLSVRLGLQVLSGTEDQAGLATSAQIRSLQDKPDAKLLSGLRIDAVLRARIVSGKTQGSDYERAFTQAYTASLKPLPWAVVGTGVKEAKSSAELLGAGLILGSVQASLDPALAKSHQLSNELAWGLIGARVNLQDVLPLKAASIAVLAQDVAANNIQKPDIWTARDVTFTAADKLTPVRVAIWDSGSDLKLFPGRLYTDPHPQGQDDPHGLAFDLKEFPTHGYLMPLDAQQQATYPTVVNDLKGLSDLQLAIDSPEADAIKHKLSTMAPADVSKYLETLNLFSEYAHGTHVAGIAARGNPAIRLAVARITFDWHNVPLPPTEELARRSAAASMAYVKWMQGHGIRIANMSWGGGPEGYEQALEKNGMGKDAAERKAIARRLFAIDRSALFEALKNAPEILFICAAGNANSDSGFNEMMPSSFKLPNLLVVGAVDQAGDEASFTSYGDTVRVDANGYHVESVLPGGAKVQFSGTSMASPNVVNLAAKLLALDPTLKPEEVISLIVEGTTPSADGRRHNIDPKRSIALLRLRHGAA
jgi:hypothetical protein